MNAFKLQNIYRSLFVVLGGEVIVSPPKQRISHGEWLKKQGWSDTKVGHFIEAFPRGYVDEEGVYIYQGRHSKEPKISEETLKRIIKILYQKVDIKNDLHVYSGVDINSSPNKKGKLPPLKDLGRISEIIET